MFQANLQNIHTLVFAGSFLPFACSVGDAPHGIGLLMEPCAMATTAWDLLCCGGLASEIVRFLLSSEIALCLLALALAAPLPVAPLPRTHRHLTPFRRPGGGGDGGEQPKTVFGVTATGTGTGWKDRWWWVAPQGSLQDISSFLFSLSRPRTPLYLALSPSRESGIAQSVQQEGAEGKARKASTPTHTSLSLSDGSESTDPARGRDPRVKTWSKARSAYSP